MTTKPSARRGRDETIERGIRRTITGAGPRYYVVDTSYRSPAFHDLNEARAYRDERDAEKAKGAAERARLEAERKRVARELAAAEREAKARLGSPWRTEAKTRLTVIVASDIDTHEVDRPRHRGECVDGPRPCPWMSCRHHLALDVDVFGGLSYHDPDRLDEMPETCALDVAAHGGLTLEEVGDLLGVTRERVRQIEAEALASVASRRALRAYSRHLAERGDRDVTEPEAYG